MPYVPPVCRPQYDELILPLARRLHLNGASAGELNYVLTQLIWTLFEQAPSYSNGAKLRSALADASQEFYERKMRPYEDKKIQENGDIDTLDLGL